MPIPPHRVAVIKALEDAGFRNREYHLPYKPAFSVWGGTSVNVTAEWWGAGDDGERELLERFARVLRAAGFEVSDRGDRLYVPWVVPD